MRWHVDRGLGSYGILTPPQACHCLDLGVEVEARLSVKGRRSSAGNTLLVASEREHGQWYWDRTVWKRQCPSRDNGVHHVVDLHVDSNLTGFNVALEASSSRARGCKDGNTVSVFVRVDEVDRFFECINVEADQDGAEDLLLVARHVLCYIGNESWPDLSPVNQHQSDGTG